MPMNYLYPANSIRILFLTLFYTLTAQAQTSFQSGLNQIYSIKTGSWNDSSVWSKNRIPTRYDTVRIQNLVSLPADYQAEASLIYYDTEGQLQMSATSNLSVLTQSPIDSAKTVYIGNRDGYVYAFHASTGSQKWKFATKSAIFYSSPTVYNQTVFIGDLDGNFYAIDAETGKEKWEVALGR